MARNSKPALQRFFKHIKENKETGCWEWTGQNGDYAKFLTQKGGKVVYSHRWAYENFIGNIPVGLFVLHTCDNPKCCNPLHLFVGTQADNMKDKCNKGRQAKGRLHGRAKLEDADIIYIRTNPDGLTQIELASAYNVSQQLISCIVRRKLWSHIP